MITVAVLFVVESFLSACCLWAGMKLTKVDGKFLGMFVIAAVSSLLGLIPGIGWLVGTVAMYALIHRWTDAEIWPDAILMVIVAKLVGVFGAILLAVLISGLL